MSNILDIPYTGKFYNVLRESSCEFLFTDFDALKTERIETFYIYMALFLDAIYNKISSLGTELTVSDNTGEYLYELGYLLGLDKIYQLSKYLNSDGTINTSLIDEQTYNKQVENQKSQLKNALSYYLSKGTLFAIKNLFEGFGSTIDITELWKSQSTDLFDCVVAGVTGVSAGVFDPYVFKDSGGNIYANYDSSLITKYGDKVFNWGKDYNYDTISFIGSLSASCPEVSAGFEIDQYIINEKNYTFVTNISSDILYFKTNEEPLGTGFLPNTWYNFDSNVKRFKLSLDYIFIEHNNNLLTVHDNTLDTGTYRGNTTIQTLSGCNHINIVEDLNVILIDMGSFIEFHRLDDFFLYKIVMKPVGHLETIKIVEKNKYNELIVVNENDYAYIIVNVNMIPEIKTPYPIGSYSISENLITILQIAWNDIHGNLVVINGDPTSTYGINIGSSITISGAMHPENDGTYTVSYIDPIAETTMFVIYVSYDATQFTSSKPETSGILIFDKLIQTSNIKNIYNISDDRFISLVNDVYGNNITSKNIIIDSGSYAISTSSEKTYLNSQIVDEQRFFEKVILLNNNSHLIFFDLNLDTFLNTQGLYPVYTTHVDGITATESGSYYNRMYFDGLINLYNKTGLNHPLQRILGFNTGTIEIFKTHYFNAIVTRTLESFTVLGDEKDVRDVIELGKPLHTQLNQLTIIDDIGVFGLGGFGVGKFGNGEYSIIQ